MHDVSFVDGVRTVFVTAEPRAVVRRTAVDDPSVEGLPQRV